MSSGAPPDEHPLLQPKPYCESGLLVSAVMSGGQSTDVPVQLSARSFDDNDGSELPRSVTFSIVPSASGGDP